MALAYQFFSEIGNDSLRTPIELGGYAFPQRGDLCDLHVRHSFLVATHKASFAASLGLQGRMHPSGTPQDLNSCTDCSLPSAAGGATTPTTGNTTVVNHGSSL